MLEGDVSVASDRMRISVRLSEADAGQITWEERYNVEWTTANLFQVQNEIALKVAVALGDESVGALFAESSDRSDGTLAKDFKSHACFVRSITDWASADQMANRFACASEAVETDPSNARAWSTLARDLASDFVFRYGAIDLPREEKRQRAIEYVDKARELNPKDPYVHSDAVLVYRYFLPPDRFWAEMEILLDSGYWINTDMGWLGMGLAHTGKWEEGIAIVEKAMALSPKAYPKGWHWAKADWLYLNGEYDAALEEYHKAATPGHIATPIHYAHIYAALGDLETAREWADKLQKYIPGFTIETAVSMFEDLNFDPDFIPLIRRDLEIAGVPGKES
ncbi:MAG: hypothetical protein AB3N13_03395 [Arenibacterium sp.]